MFCMTTCRPDTAHAVNLLSRRMSQPRVCDLRAARRVVRYLRDTSPGQGTPSSPISDVRE
jgi:hypothetical protein